MESDRRKYLHKKSYLEARLQKDVLEDGIAYIPCKVEGMSDIISKYSIEGCESVDQGFLDYINSFLEYIPSKYPVVLSICGHKFSDEEKEIITDTIMSEMHYMLGKTEAYNRRKKKIFIFMSVGTIITGLLLYFLLRVAIFVTTDIPIEFFYVLFWLFADAFVRYLFIDKLDLNYEKMRRGWQASIRVEFEDPEETKDPEEAE